MCNPRWRRVCDARCRAKSVFHFDVQCTVAKSSHAGIPWLRFLRQQLDARVHFWPFDGWHIAEGRSVVAEVYPALWKKAYPMADRTPDQHDAYTVATWLQQADRDGRLQAALAPSLVDPVRPVAEVEGWKLGVS